MFEVNEFSGFEDVPDQSEPGALPRLDVAQRSGLLHGTRVVTSRGWLPVEKLEVGDSVLTVDHVLKEITGIRHDGLFVAEDDMSTDNRPVRVPVGAVNNRRPLWLLPEQPVLIRCYAAENPVGDGCIVVPARLLNGMCGITSDIPGDMLGITSLSLEQEEVICIEGGMMAFCPGTGAATEVPENRPYDVLTGAAAEAAMEAMAGSSDPLPLALRLNRLSSLVPRNTVMPARPAKILRREGRPGRPKPPVLRLREEWLG